VAHLPPAHRAAFARGAPDFGAGLVASTFRNLLGLSTWDWAADRMAALHPALEGAAPLLASAVGLSAAALLLVGGLRSPGWRMLVAACAYWGLLAAVSLTAAPVFYYRTAMPGLVPFVGFAALRLASLPTAYRRLAFGAVGTAIVVLLAHWWLVASRAPIEPWRELAQAVGSAADARTAVLCYPDYIEGPLRYHGADHRSGPMLAVPPGTAAEGLAALMPPAPVVLVVRRDVTVTKDQSTYRELLAQLERRHGAPCTHWERGSLIVSLYQQTTADARAEGAGR
jgi:hypothetical protein